MIQNCFPLLEVLFRVSLLLCCVFQGIVLKKEVGEQNVNHNVFGFLVSLGCVYHFSLDLTFNRKVQAELHVWCN